MWYFCSRLYHQSLIPGHAYSKVHCYSVTSLHADSGEVEMLLRVNLFTCDSKINHDQRTKMSSRESAFLPTQHSLHGGKGILLTRLNVPCSSSGLFPFTQLPSLNWRIVQTLRATVPPLFLCKPLITNTVIYQWSHSSF